MAVRIKRATPKLPEWTEGYKFKARTGTGIHEFELVNVASMVAVMSDSRSRPWFVSADRRTMKLSSSNVVAQIL